MTDFTTAFDELTFSSVVITNVFAYCRLPPVSDLGLYIFLSKIDSDLKDSAHPRNADLAVGAA